MYLDWEGPIVTSPSLGAGDFWFFLTVENVLRGWDDNFEIVWLRLPRDRDEFCSLWVTVGRSLSGLKNGFFFLVLVRMRELSRFTGVISSWLLSSSFLTTGRLSPDSSLPLSRKFTSVFNPFSKLSILRAEPMETCVRVSCLLGLLGRFGDRLSLSPFVFELELFKALFYLMSSECTLSFFILISLSK